MHDMLAEATQARPIDAAPAADGRLTRLAALRPGDQGVIVEVQVTAQGQSHGVAEAELERRLLEFGFVEGAQLQVLHEGAIRRDPIAVRLDDMRVALRRRDAEDVWVLLETK
jgi:ferrous iron transport protein A